MRCESFFRSLYLSPPLLCDHLEGMDNLSLLCMHTFSTGLGNIDRISYPEKSVLHLLAEEGEEPTHNYPVCGTVHQS